jgi:hypothetical protein
MCRALRSTTSTARSLKKEATPVTVPKKIETSSSKKKPNATKKPSPEAPLARPDFQEDAEDLDGTIGTNDVLVMFDDTCSEPTIDPASKDSVMKEKDALGVPSMCALPPPP